jgi:peroxiredoxin
MKRHCLLLLLTLILVSCGTDGSHFKIDGRLLNLDQGEFYVYSTDGLISGVDTIHVRAGRFTYEIPCDDKGTLVIVFPNFSEQPVFAQSGKTADIKGDASHLKEMKVTGTKDNKLMNKFRELSSGASPDETKHYAELFVGDHPESLVSVYLVQRYFVKAPQPDYDKAVKLYKTLVKAQPNNGRLAQEQAYIESIAKVGVGKKIPSFTATATDGRKITQADLTKGKAIVYLWATWEFESCSMQRVIQEQLSSADNKLTALGICLDTSEKECLKIMERDKVTSPVVCEQLMFDSKIVKRLGLTSVPDNILLDNGKITARNIPLSELRDMLKQ